MIKRFGKILLLFAIVLACSKDDPIAITGNISGTVTEATSSTAVAGANVSLTGETNQSTSTGSSGSFGFNNITAGSYQISVSKSGYVSQTKSVTLQAEKTASVSFSLQKNLPVANPNQLELTTEENSKTIELENTRSGVINFTSQTSKEWLKVNPSTGSINQGNKLIITVSADLENVPYNTYNENLVINVGEASLSIPVKIVHTEPPYITITSPKKDEVYKMGSIMPIKWDSNLEGKVSIDLIRASEVKAEISTETENDNGGSFNWEIPALEEEYYTLRVTSKENDKISNETEPFKINEGPTVPVVETGEAIESGINFLKVGGEIVSLGLQADQVDQYGHVYSISNETPTVADARTKYGVSKETKTYTSDITSLKSAETYYVRAYATNGKGTSYGDIITMTTKSGGPIVTTSDPTDITENSAKVGGSISSDGGSTITERGVFYGLTDELNSDSDAAKDSSTEVGSFTISLTGLKKGTVYYVMAYAKNSSGYGYGEVKKLNTQGDPPTVKTKQVDKVSGTQAEVTGDITSTGGEPLSSYGFVYSKNSSPTVEDTKIEVGQEGSGEFKGTLTGLSVSTKYYVRAYAINPRGTSYGEELSFTTLDGKPGVTTLGYEDVTGNAATIKGRIDDTGGEDLTSYGFAYAETANPTVDGFKLEVGKNGDGDYEGTITGLKTETKYYVRAYATNSNGTSYGDELDFTTTDGLPKVVTVGSRDIESDKAVLTGTIQSNGGSDLTSYGFVYSEEEDPTLEDNKVEVGENATGGYSGTASNLVRLTAYYYKAYATNSAGTSYGEQLSFKTADGPYFAITAPELNQNVSVGKPFNITWDTNKTNDNLTIEHWNGDNKTELSNNTPIGAKTFTWSVPDDATKGSENIIRLIENSGEKSHDSPKFNLSDLTYVPDDTFEQTLIDNGWDDKLDDYVDTSNISGVEDLTLSEVVDVTGIEDFVGLKKLLVKSYPNSISTKVIDLSRLIVLKELEFDANSFLFLESLVLPDSSVLESLVVVKHSGDWNTKLNPIDFSKATGLKTVSVTAFSNFTNLDFSNNLELESITFYSNSLNNVNLSKNTKLTNIELMGYFNGKPNTLLKSIDFSNNTALDRIYITYTGLENVDVSMLGDLSVFVLEGNDDLRCIKLNQNQYNNLGSKGDSWRKPPTATWSTNCEEVYVPDDNFEKELIRLGYDDVLDNYVLKGNISGVLSLELANKAIQDLTGIEAFESLSTLKAPGGAGGISSGYNDITSGVDLSSLDNLELLTLSKNYNLSSITLPNNSNKITGINLDYTSVQKLNLSKYEKLRQVLLNNNANLTELDISENTEIISLNIARTGIRHIDLTKIENKLQGFAFYSSFNEGDTNVSLECIRVSRSFLDGKIGFNGSGALPNGWRNDYYSASNGKNVTEDILRILCYDLYIDLRRPDGESNEMGKTIKFDASGNLYVGLQNYGSTSSAQGGEIYRYDSPDSRTLVAGRNGDGTSNNQITAHFTFTFDSSGQNLYVLDGNTSIGSSSDKFRRISKWPIGSSVGNVVATFEESDLDSDETIGRNTNIVVDNDNNLYFHSNKYLYKISSGSTSYERILDKNSFDDANWGSGTGGQYWDYNLPGLEITDDNELLIMGQYTGGNQHVLSIDLSDNNKVARFRSYIPKGEGVVEGGDTGGGVNFVGHKFARSSTGPLITYNADNLKVRLNGRNYNANPDLENITSFMYWRGGKDETDAVIKDGYVYILDGDRILKSTTPIE